MSDISKVRRDVMAPAVLTTLVSVIAGLSVVGGAAASVYVLVHAGFAIQKWSEQDVREYREIMEEMAEGESKF